MFKKIPLFFERPDPGNPCNSAGQMANRQPNSSKKIQIAYIAKGYATPESKTANMKFLRFPLWIFMVQFATAQPLSITGLLCEHKINPMGVDAVQPRLSWKINSNTHNTLQTAYDIRVATDSSFTPGSIQWETGKLGSDSSILQVYRGPVLRSGQRYYWQVKVWDNHQRSSDWSKPAFWEMGLLRKSDWVADWIEPSQDTAREIPALMVRKEFGIPKKIKAARVYVTSHGLYQLFINGEKVGKDQLTPGWTSYDKRLQYQVYDVTDRLNNGINAIGAMLGDGWYRGSLAWGNNWGIWGKKLGLLCQLEIFYTDGTKQIISSDPSWKSTSSGPVTLDGIYAGESYDARKEMPGWDEPGFDDHLWKNVSRADYPRSNLIGMETVPVQEIQEIRPVKIFRTPKGNLIVDLGQNMVGWVRLKVRGPAGTTVILRHAEVMDKSGEFYTANLRAAAATIRYTLKGEGEEVYEPHFTFMGFRYVEVQHYPGTLTPDDITGIVVHSNMQPTGDFVCSDSLVNRLQHNIQWGQKGNFLDVPTDCPQRDERLGWTGDAQAFCRTAGFNMDVSAFFTKWMKDIAADQDADGAVPFVIPDVLRYHATSAGWGDVATIAPWTMYQLYGDKRILQTQYPSMKAYVDYIIKKAGDRYLWKGGSIFGDWLFYKSDRQTESDGYTDPDMIATMFYAYSARLLSRAAGVLGNVADEKYYENIFEKVKEAFQKNYVTPEGRIASDSQTAYVLALKFDLLPVELDQKAVGYLVADIKSRHNHLSTGFLGTPYLCYVLSKYGQTGVAYDLLLQQTYPSWLYPVKMGATTIWERWDGEKPDSTFEDPGMNSFNHYAYGAIGDWMYRVVAGIEAASPGYKKILIQPHPDPRLQFARAVFQSSYGEIVSGWERKSGRMVITVTIPANTTATVILPETTPEKVTESGNSLVDFSGVHTEGTGTVLDLGSGDYVFSYPLQ